MGGHVCFHRLAPGPMWSIYGGQVRHILGSTPPPGGWGHLGAGAAARPSHDGAAPACPAETRASSLATLKPQVPTWALDAQLVPHSRL